MAIGTGAAILGGAALGLGGTMMASKSASKAAGTQAAAADAATQAQLEMYYQGRQDTAPWRAAGANALQKLLGDPIYGSGSPTPTQTTTAQPTAQPGSLMNPATGMARMAHSAPVFDVRWDNDWGEMVGALEPGGPPIRMSQIQQMGNIGLPQTPGGPGYSLDDVRADLASQYQQAQPGQMTGQPGQGEITGYSGGGLMEGPGEFKESPSYQFMLGEGMKGIQRGASATGRLASGAYLKDATRYAEGLASTEYDNFLRRYYESLNPWLSMAGMGQVSAGQAAGQAGSAGNTLAQIALNKGQSQAAGNLGAAYPWTQFANWGAGNMMQYGMQNYGGGGNALSGMQPGNSLYYPGGNAYKWTPQQSNAFFNY